MNAEEIRQAIDSGSPAAKDEALREVLDQVEVLSTAVLEIAGTLKLKTGQDPISARSRQWLSGFIEPRWRGLSARLRKEREQERRNESIPEKH